VVNVECSPDHPVDQAEVRVEQQPPHQAHHRHTQHERREGGYEVPGDVMVMGFDDIQDGRFATPTLSTVAPDKALIAQSAVDLLAERLSGGTDKAHEVCVPHRLAFRESTDLPVKGNSRTLN
jgi:hypothetical protein